MTEKGRLGLGGQVGKDAISRASWCHTQILNVLHSLHVGDMVWGRGALVVLVNIDTSSCN